MLFCWYPIHTCYVRDRQNATGKIENTSSFQRIGAKYGVLHIWIKGGFTLPKVLLIIRELLCSTYRKGEILMQKWPCHGLSGVWSATGAYFVSSCFIIQLGPQSHRNRNRFSPVAVGPAFTGSGAFPFKWTIKPSTSRQILFSKFKALGWKLPFNITAIHEEIIQGSQSIGTFEISETHLWWNLL